MSGSREKFATQVDSALLSDLRGLAKEEGRQIQVLVDEALADLIEKHRSGRARAHVMRAYRTSHAPFGRLYKNLAK